MCFAQPARDQEGRAVNPPQLHGQTAEIAAKRPGEMENLAKRRNEQ